MSPGRTSNTPHEPLPRVPPAVFRSYPFGREGGDAPGVPAGQLAVAPWGAKAGAGQVRVDRDLDRVLRRKVRLDPDVAGQADLRAGPERELQPGAGEVGHEDAGAGVADGHDAIEQVAVDGVPDGLAGRLVRAVPGLVPAKPVRAVDDDAGEAVLHGTGEPGDAEALEGLGGFADGVLQINSDAECAHRHAPAEKAGPGAWLTGPSCCSISNAKGGVSTFVFYSLAREEQALDRI
ncbi:hypothetical protein [Methylobacterium sp. WL120]|uniref:hypothetical protein n=1 Tax=Methylobacterium sp. WL120 TaxID=2603887 RepID=UPI001FEE63D0|nr:hypothetical protein [Methylobacterium sp. WL120]